MRLARGGGGRGRGEWFDASGTLGRAKAGRGGERGRGAMGRGGSSRFFRVLWERRRLRSGGLGLAGFSGFLQIWWIQVCVIWSYFLSSS